MAEHRTIEAAAIDALVGLVQRLWCGDRPDTSALREIDAWAHNLSVAERAALNASLGENFGGRDHWDSDNPIARTITEATNE